MKGIVLAIFLDGNDSDDSDDSQLEDWQINAPVKATPCWLSMASHHAGSASMAGFEDLKVVFQKGWFPKPSNLLGCPGSRK